ncbi:hypothetical protein AC629_06580 [Bradyrhizobium sp. NAS80.1]|nr:hypothetical protein AC629_06580 [Bradyrhizobium sp. NAS80.1]
MTQRAIARHLETSEAQAESRRWRPGFFIVLLCAVLIALAAFAQPPAKVLIRPTSSLPAVNVP